MLRLTPLLALAALPLALSRVLAFHNRERPPALFSPRADAVVLASFPIAWFFGFLYYTELPGLVGVTATIAAAAQGKHWVAGLVRSSCYLRERRLMEEEEVDRCCELFIQADERRLGAVRVCGHSAHVLEVPEGVTRWKGAGEAL
jgi:hypothetical protein